jgi:hypothetical protein
METVFELRRQLIETETIAANAVEEMDRKLTEAKRMLAAVVLAVGGDVRVGKRDLIKSNDCALTIGDDPSTGGVRVTVHRTL